MKYTRQSLFRISVFSGPVLTLLWRVLLFSQGEEEGKGARRIMEETWKARSDQKANDRQFESKNDRRQNVLDQW